MPGNDFGISRGCAQSIVALAPIGPENYVYPTRIYLDLAMAKSTVFTSNRSQAVRLPKAVAFPEGVHQVEIIKLGQSRLITPAGRRWDDFFLTAPHATEDFMIERDQSAVEEREPL